MFLVTVVNQMGFTNAQTYRFTIATTAFGALLGIFGLPLLNQLLDRFRRPAADTSGDASKR